MNYIRVVENKETPAIIVEPDKPKFTALLLHGYGGSKEEMLPIAYRLALVGIAGLAVDLPGHGQNKDLFNYDNAMGTVERVVSLHNPKAVVGHSIGGRLGLKLGLPIVVISPPLTIAFAGSRAEMLKILRARRAREEQPYMGLRNVLEKLAGDLGDSAASITIYGGHDLKTVKDFAKKRRSIGGNIMMVKGAGHLDIISAEETLKKVPAWIIKKVTM